MSNFFEDVVSSAYGVDVNMNDVFGWACADSENIEGSDLVDLKPYWDKYGDDALMAYASIARGCDLIKPRMTDTFKQVRAEILAHSLDISKEKQYDFYSLRRTVEHYQKHKRDPRTAAQFCRENNVHPGAKLYRDEDEIMVCAIAKDSIIGIYTKWMNKELDPQYQHEELFEHLASWSTFKNV